MKRPLTPTPAAEIPTLDQALRHVAYAHPMTDPALEPPSPPAPTPTDSTVAWPTVVMLRRRCADEISQVADRWAAEHAQPMPAEDRRLMGRSVVRQVVRRHAEELATSGQALWTLEVEQQHARAVEDAIFGYGRMQPLFEIPDAENIEIHGWDSVMVQYEDGRRSAHRPVADSDAELVEAVRFLGETTTPPRPFDDAHPMMTVALGDRFRLHAIGFGLSYRPSIIIRQHRLTRVTLAELSGGGMMPDEVAQLLNSAVLARKSIVISGDQGAGKTTLLRALIDAIPETERFGTLETDYELLTHLQPHRRNMLALQAKVGLGETQDGRAIGSWSVGDLIPEALRQNLARLVVGEVRGSEAGAMFEAMQTGAGTLSTIHSRTATATIDRMASRVAQGGVLTTPEAYRQIAQNIGLIVHVNLEDNTWRGGVRRRHISEIRELTGAIEGERPVTHLAYQAASADHPAVFYPSPELSEELRPFDSAWQAGERTRQG